MKIEELSLDGLLRHTGKNATLSFMQQRVLIFDAMSLGLLRKELLDTLGYDRARKVLTRFGYAHGWRTAKMMQSEFSELVQQGHAGEYLHRLFGLVNTTEFEMNDGDGEAPLIRAKMENSYEAEQQLRLIGPADEKVCWTLAGFASGYESYKHQREVYFIETQCVAKGDPYCQMEGRFKEAWGDRIDAHLYYFDADSIDRVLTEQELEIQQLERRLQARRQELELLQEAVDPIPGFIARSPNITKLLGIARRAAQTESTILVSGDSGVGKEHISRYVHQASARADGPFISVNCGALTESLLEAELFGHVKGAFTGAEKTRSGLFEEANGGTIFLDEIGETSLSMQVKLLRVLQEREVKRIGENASRKLDVRIISATNKDLAEEVRKGNFRQDLFYRLRVIELQVPSLQQRREDILPIATLFLHRFSLSMGRDLIGLSRGAIKILLDYPWPGNVRELANVMEYAVALCNGEWVEEWDLPPELTHDLRSQSCESPLAPLVQVEKQHVLAVLNHHKGDKAAAAATLGIALSTLYRKLSNYSTEWGGDL